MGSGGETARLLAEAKKHNVAPDADMVAASMEAQVFFGIHRVLCLPAYD
jgi:hypothetical protein